jgi:hypothetical protein
LIGAENSGAARASVRAASLSRWATVVSVALGLYIVAPSAVRASPQTTAAESQRPQTRRDSFPHSRHEKLGCLTCHRSGAEHGQFRIERPSGCYGCHHKEPTPAKCATCHRPEQYGAVKHATVTITVPGQQPKPRTVDFYHERHSSKSCLECHTTPVTLAPAPTKVVCKDCHEDHHAAGRRCSSCHTLAEPKAAHRTVEIAHQRCDACHTATIVNRLTPTRSLCSTCHPTKAVGHYDAKECTVCHFLATPASYRARLVTRPPS